MYKRFKTFLIFATYFTFSTLQKFFSGTFFMSILSSSSSSSSSWSAVASRRCDMWPNRFFRQFQGIGHGRWYSCVPADLMNPSGGRSTTGTSLKVRSCVEKIWYCSWTQSQSVCLWSLEFVLSIIQSMLEWT